MTSVVSFITKCFNQIVQSFNKKLGVTVIIKKKQLKNTRIINKH